jgi:hypothetical protein
MGKTKRAARRGTSRTSARGKSRRRTSRAHAAPAASSTTGVVADPAADLTSEDQLVASTLSLHELFAQQTRQILDRADLEEEQKQHILVAMSCPCCGAGAMSFTAKLRR